MSSSRPSKRGQPATTGGGQGRETGYSRPTDFFVDDQPLTLHTLPAMVRQVIALLEAGPTNRVYRTRQMVARLGYALTTFQTHHAAHPALSQYRHGGRGAGVLWGHPTAILELQRRLREHDD